MLSQMPLTDCHLYALHAKDGVIFHKQYLNVLGGYRNHESVLLLYRDMGDGLHLPVDGIGKLSKLPSDGIGKLSKDCTYTHIRLGAYDEQEYLLDEDWPTFSLLVEGHDFKLGGRQWTKMSSTELKGLISNNAYGVL